MKKQNITEELKDLIIAKVRNKKDRNYVTTKFNAGWTELQKDVWQEVKLQSPRVRISGKVYANSVMYTSGYLINKDGTLKMDFIKEFSKYFYNSIQDSMKYFDYDYIDFDEYYGKIKDLKNGVSFEGFSFTIDSLKEDLDKNGSFFPMYAYKHKEPGALIVCGGRHRLAAINQLVREGKWNHRKILCMFWDSYTQPEDLEVILPTIIVEKMLKKLDIKIENYKEEFSKITINNIVDLWIVQRVLEKELDLLVEKHEKELLDNGIIAPDFINLRR